PSRAHRRGPGDPCADAGKHDRLQHGRPSLAWRVRRAREGAWLSADADAVAAALCDGGWAYLSAGDDGPAMAQPVRGARLPGADRGFALLVNSGPHRQYRRALHDP